jgi:hypothetical protein
MRGLLWRDRRDSAWEVVELVEDTEYGKVPKSMADYCKRLRDENAALRDAIDALHDCVSGERTDYAGVIAMLNGAMRIAGPTAPREYECPFCLRHYTSTSRTTETIKCQCGTEARLVANAKHEPRAVASRAPCSCSASGYDPECKWDGHHHA